MKIDIKPKLNTTSKDRNPMTTPAMWGTVFKYPKFLPDAVSIILLGPGVPDWITHKSSKGKKYSSIEI